MLSSTLGLDLGGLEITLILSGLRLIGQTFLARDAFVRTNRRAIVMMFVRPSVCLGRACIVIIRCILAQI